MDKVIGQIYYWILFVINFALPFVLLLIMNTVIIKTIRSNSKFRQTLDISKSKRDSGQGQSEGHVSKIKKSEMLIFAILLLVTFAFLILTTPTYVLVLYIMFVDYTKSPKDFAGFHLFYNVGHKTYYTNYGINFFLYVMSGQKFRKDLMHLFIKRKQDAQDNSVTLSGSTRSIEVKNIE